MTLRVGVIGAGAMGAHHARVLSDLPDVQLAGVADAEPARAEALARRYRAASFVDAAALIDAADAVVIAAPTTAHATLAGQCMAAGVHVLVEKPLVHDLDAGIALAAQLQRSTSRAGRRLVGAVGHIERFNPAVEQLKTRLGAGELGRIFQIEVRRQGPFPARVSDVGVILDLCVHDVDIVRHLTGAEVHRISAEKSRRIHREHEDMVAALLRMSSGVLATLNVNWLTPTKVRELRVIGERGMFHVDLLTQDLYLYQNSSASEYGWDAMEVLRGVSEGQVTRFVVAKKEPLRAQLECFVRACNGERKLPVSFDDGLEALRIARQLVDEAQG